METRLYINVQFCRDLDLVILFADAVLKCPPEVSTKLPFYEDFANLEPTEVELLLKTQVMRYAFNTRKKYFNPCNRYFEFCKRRSIENYPVNAFNFDWGNSINWLFPAKKADPLSYLTSFKVNIDF